MVRKAALKEFAQNGDYDFKYDISYGALSKEEDYDIFTWINFSYYSHYFILS